MAKCGPRPITRADALGAGAMMARFTAMPSTAIRASQPDLAETLRRSFAKGTFFNRRIRDRFRCTREPLDV